MNQDIPVLIYSRTHIGPIQYIHTQYYIHVTSYCNSIKAVAIEMYLPLIEPFLVSVV